MVDYRTQPGPYLWEVCDRCNYNRHICGGCGAELSHAEDVNGWHYQRYHADEDEVRISRVTHSDGQPWPRRA